MDAIYSGQAGVMTVIEGAEARVRRADNFESEFTIGREGVAYLFRGCTDVVVVKGAHEDALRAPFEDAWEADRALRLFLISMDPEEEPDLRTDAADCLEGLVTAKNSTRIFIENELYARVMPSDADYEFLSDSQRWELVSQMVSEIVASQGSITERRDAWDRLPSNLFPDNNKAEFEECAIRGGVFRMLASVDLGAGDRNLAILSCYQALAAVPNSRAVINEWTANFNAPV